MGSPLEKIGQRPDLAIAHPTAVAQLWPAANERVWIAAAAQRSSCVCTCDVETFCPRALFQICRSERRRWEQEASFCRWSGD